MPCPLLLPNALAVAPKVLSSIGQKGQVPGPLDRHGQTPLMPGASSRSAAGGDLAPISDKAAQKVGALVVYDINPVYAKGAYLATRDISLTTAFLAPSIPRPLPVVIKVFVWQIYLPSMNLIFVKASQWLKLERKLIAFKLSLAC
jgi:hypothetical protein